ncbi:MAG: hypothetical protein ABI793_13420 [Flavobacterium sp.]
MNIQRFTKLKIAYKRIAIGSVLLFALPILLFTIEIFILWGICGEGTSAGRVSELWYVEVILDYLPIVIIGGYLVFKAIANYRKQKYIEFKTSITILIIIFFLFLIRNKIFEIIF